MSHKHGISYSDQTLTPSDVKYVSQYMRSCMGDSIVLGGGTLNPKSPTTPLKGPRILGCRGAFSPKGLRGDMCVQRLKILLTLNPKP